MAHRARAPKNGANGDADHDEIEQLAKSRAAAIKAGHNSNDVPDETYLLHLEAIKNKRSAIEVLMQEVSQIRQGLSNAKTLAKKDKCDVKAIIRTLDLEKLARENGSSGIVAEHRTVGRLLKLLNVPLGFQFHLFDLPETDSDGAKIDAALQGEQAGRAGEPSDNCPYQAGTPDAFSWRNGHQIGVDAVTDAFRGGKPIEAAAH